MSIEFCPKKRDTFYLALLTIFGRWTLPQESLAEMNEGDETSDQNIFWVFDHVEQLETNNTNLSKQAAHNKSTTENAVMLYC